MPVMTVFCVDCDKSESKVIETNTVIGEMESDGWHYEYSTQDWYCEDCYRQEMEGVDRYQESGN